MKKDIPDNWMAEFRKTPSYKWYSFISDIKHFLRKKGLMKCNHDGIVGGVGAKEHLCLDCDKIVANTDYEMEKEWLEKKKKSQRGCQASTD